MDKFVYCPGCEEYKGELSTSDNYCSTCGSELEVRSKEEVREKVHENIDWPLEITFSEQVKIDRDIAPEIKEAIDSKVLPFDWEDDRDVYYIDDIFGVKKVTFRFYKDGTREVIDTE